MKLIKLLMTDHGAEALELLLKEQEEEGTLTDAFTMHIEDAGQTAFSSAEDAVLINDHINNQGDQTNETK